MRKKFIIGLDKNDGNLDKKFVEYINGFGAGYWHWFSDLWLIDDTKGNLSMILIRDKLKELKPKIYTMVFEIPGECNQWAGLAPTGEGKNYFKWMHENWDKINK